MQDIFTKTDLQNLYEIDDHLWLQETIKLLKSHRFNELDLDNLIEELESLGRRDKNKATSLLEQVIRHLLLLQFWTEEYEDNAAHWESEIDSFRTQLKRHLTTNLYQHLEQEYNNIYDDALRYVTKKTRLKSFPKKSPYTLEQVIDINWLP
ncbi:DUF29 domain-containing protein [Crocosphaera sp. UHCC 0190]|uniref:DUF29 domain-containing protein n=1 Tax=Crocosphaera sp. UHCC 0190 TaxID=3110246 RepID=UPI002B20520E|nr:DUF29 domain-containing protein [Crocosphaera sp. UHCC 0190]MEA5509172.1 DUF29 domain-containing protein [Crocosphaera sp. UHCC 0190]